MTDITNAVKETKYSADELKTLNNSDIIQKELLTMPDFFRFVILFS